MKVLHWSSAVVMCSFYGNAYWISTCAVHMKLYRVALHANACRWALAVDVNHGKKWTKKWIFFRSNENITNWLNPTELLHQKRRVTRKKMEQWKCATIFFKRYVNLMLWESAKCTLNMERYNERQMKIDTHRQNWLHVTKWNASSKFDCWDNMSKDCRKDNILTDKRRFFSLSLDEIHPFSRCTFCSFLQ